MSQTTNQKISSHTGVESGIFKEASLRMELPLKLSYSIDFRTTIIYYNYPLVN